MSINSVCITGNLTRDVEIRATPGGVTIASFTVAVNERHKDQSTGKLEDKPNFIDCKMFGKRADGVAPYLTKGSKVALSGRLSYSQWEKDGQHRSKLEVIAEDIEFMGGREKQETYSDTDIPF